MQTDEGIEEQRQLLAIHRRTLAHYLQQQAVAGTAHSPPGIRLGIDEARREIQRIKSSLRSLSVMVEDHPNDESIESMDTSRQSEESEKQSQKITVPEASGEDSRLVNQGLLRFVDEYFKAVEVITIEIVQSVRAEVNELKDHNKKLSSTIERLDDELSRLRIVIYPGGLADEGDIREEISHQSALRREFTRRLRALELEQARKGIDTPPQVEVQIDDIHNRLNEIDARIKILTYDLAHRHNTRSEEQNSA